MHWTSSDDIGVLAETGTTVAHCPTVFSRRGITLRTIGEYSPAANTIAAKYKNDKEFFVKSTAERILKGEVKKKQRK